MRGDLWYSNKGMRGLVRRLRPHWRKMTWVVMIFNVVMVIWLIAGLASAPGSTNARCAGEQYAHLCHQASDVGTAIGAGLIIGLWVAGDVILGVLWLVTNRKSATQ